MRQTGSSPALFTANVRIDRFAELDQRPSNQSMKPTAPLRNNLQVCHDTLPWLISFSLGRDAQVKELTLFSL